MPASGRERAVDILLKAHEGACHQPGPENARPGLSPIGPIGATCKLEMAQSPD
jgi:hypothetical protein